MKFIAARSVAALVLAVVVAGPVAANISTGNLTQDVQSALSNSGNVNVTLKDGVATLTGYADGISRFAAERAALAAPGVDSVVNLIDYNS